MAPRQDDGGSNVIISDAPLKTENLPKKEGKSISKSSIGLQLGSYKSTRLFIGVVIFTYFYVNYAMFLTSHPPHPISSKKFLLQNEFLSVVITILYILFSLTWGPRFMKDKEPIKLKRCILVYNAIQVVINGYIFIEGGLAAWFFNYSWKCEPENFEVNPYQERIVNVWYIYLITKILDWGDTVFFILAKKWENVTLLHVFHHAMLYYGIWNFFKYTPNGQNMFVPWINSSVHVALYCYYLLAALGPSVRPYLWWKKYLTKIQLAQFIAIMIHGIVGAYNGCKLNPFGQLAVVVYAFIFFLLFMDFYKMSYTNLSQGKRESSLKSASATAVENTKSNGNIEFNGRITEDSRKRPNASTSRAI